MQITQKLLLEAGGWQAMKTAKTLCDAGRATEVSYEPPLLKALVKDGGIQYKSGLNIASASRIDNLCSCRESRQWGKICAHSLAAGLAWMNRAAKPIPAAAASASVTPTASARPRSPFIIDDATPDFRLHLILPPNLEAAENVEKVMVVAEVEKGARRSSLAALGTIAGHRCEALDALALELLSAFSSGKLPGMVMFTPIEFSQFAMALADHPRVTLGKGKSVDLGKFAQRFTPIPDSPTPQTSEKAVAVEQFALTIEGSLNHLGAQLSVIREGALFRLPSDREASTAPEESEAMARLEGCGFIFHRLQSEWVLRGEMAIIRFFATELPKLQRLWKVTIGLRFTNITAEIERIEPRITIRDAGERWFDLDMTLQSASGTSLSPDEVQRLLRSGQNSYRKSNGKLAVFDGGLIEDFQQALAESAPRQIKAGSYRIDRRHAPHLQSVLDFSATVQGTSAWETWVNAARQQGREQPVPLGAFEDILRPYQKQGVYWMHFLARHHLGGILADEMGLGKTVQTLAFLSLAPATTRLPSLVVCPSSLVFNWKQEAERFAPGLRVQDYTSATAKSVKSLGDVDLLVTSYGMLRSQADFFHQASFHAVILDEAQHIKNASTQNAKLATAVRANCRFALTGTPLENSLLDLWSLMNFALPNYLGDKKTFAEQYAEATQGESVANSLKKLSARIAPYMLRRRKKEILTELPEKTIQILRAPMGSAQAKRHQQLVQFAHAELNELASQPGNRLKIFALLTKLRQTACDVRLLDSREDISEQDASGKLRLFEELLSEIIDGQRRVLVFSQFVGMLKLLAAFLERNGTRFSYLDGSTSNRAKVVSEFKGDPEIPVFLISLKAGGVGLNLTEADTVIHFDPWWNPAVEAQASDRVHRIGQTRAVTIYKLISAGSIEEKMLKLQDQKRSMLEGILEEANVASRLGIEEIRALIEE